MTTELTLNNLGMAAELNQPRPLSYLETIVDKKVNDVALSCLEKIVDWFLATFSCFYPAYDRLYQARLSKPGVLYFSELPHLDNFKASEYVFRAIRTESGGHEGCCGTVSIQEADRVLTKLQEKATPGISFDSTIYHRPSPYIRGTCTAMSLEFAVRYLNLREQDADPGSKRFVDQLQLLSEGFKRSSEEMRSRQIAYSSITVDRTVDMDITKSKILSCVRYHDFEINYDSQEWNIVEDAASVKGEISALPEGVYFIRMLKPGENHKLETRGHSMIYVQEQEVAYFYEPNVGLERITDPENSDSLFYERLLNVHRQWDIPQTRFYRLQQPLAQQRPDLDNRNN